MGDSPKIQSLNKKALVSYEISTKSVNKKLDSSKPENNGSMSSILRNKSNKQGTTESIKNVSELEKSVESSQFFSNINPDESNISRGKKFTCAKCGTCGTCGTIPCKNALSYRTPSFVQRINNFPDSAKKQTQQEQILSSSILMLQTKTMCSLKPIHSFILNS